MENKQIYNLLKEACDENTSSLRKNKIQCVLGKETSAFNGVYYEIDTPAAGIHLIFNILYMDIIYNKPNNLNQILPTFLLICGEKQKQYHLSIIDWDFVNSKIK